MRLVDQTLCTGCGACEKACPKGAIRFREDEEGFPAPVIDNAICIECGLCSTVCPAIHVLETRPVLSAYAAQAKDRELLMESTSGALFPVLAREIFRRQGVVFGCVWDAEYNAVFTRAESEEQIGPMKGSKYVWSWAGDMFPEVKQELDAGKTVLFAGLPCQVAGLKGFLRKEYDKLYLLDLLCSGTPSPLAFHKYLETIASKEDLPELNFKFRDKNPWGVGVHITYRGQKRVSRHGEHIKNPYYYAFYTHLMDRRSCYQCPYGSDQRISDITIGDFWGVKNFHGDMDAKSGVSALLINTERGADLLTHTVGELELQLTKTEYISKANSLYLNGRGRDRVIPLSRKSFFSLLKENGWKAAEKKCLHTGKRTFLKLKTTELAHVVSKAKRAIMK